jgi:hypothetical protein
MSTMMRERERHGVDHDERERERHDVDHDERERE